MRWDCMKATNFSSNFLKTGAVTINLLADIQLWPPLISRDAAHVCAEAGPENDEVGAAMNVLAQPLVALGLTRAQALSCQGSVIALTLGWATYEQSPPMRAYLSKALNLQASYRQGLEAMVLGMSQGSPK